MIWNYCKIALRNLWKHKTFTIVNIVGLAVAFGATILLSLTAFHELSFDQFHTNKQSLYQLYSEEHNAGKTGNSSSFPIPFTPALKKEYPGIAHATRFGYLGNSVMRYKDHEFNYDIRTVDPDFLDMFSFPLRQGDPHKALQDPGNIVLTEKVAKNIFGAEQPVGHAVEIRTGDTWKSYIVSGITGDVPENSSIGFSALTRFENFHGYKNNQNEWGNRNHEVFVQLSPQSSQQAFEKGTIKFVHKYYDSAIIQMKLDGGLPDKDGEFIRIRMVPLSDIHFSPVSPSARVSKFYPYLLLLISAFILFIASINFVNLSMGRAFTRAGEIGVRKVLGAGRRQILFQFWGEAVIICGMALILGMGLAMIFLPGYKTLFTQHVSTAMLTTPLFIFAIIAGFGLVCLLAGGYPAWVLSALNAARTVKGKISVGKGHRLRNGLMIVQFVLSGLLIICTTIVWQQVNYMRNAPLGFDKQQILSIPIGSNIDGVRAMALMRAGLAKLPNVLSVSGNDANMGLGRDNSNSTSILGFTYKGKSIHTHWQRIDYDYVKTLGLQLVKGRDLSRDFSTDSNAVIINEKMAAALGEKEAVNMSIPMDDGSKLRVVGIVKDFNFQSLRQEIDPLTMTVSKEPLSYIFVKVAPGNLPASIQAVTKIWKNINPKAEQEISFPDENTDKQYRAEDRLSRIFITGALLTILISCMGLFAIVILVLGQRTREIGIRKVLGASVINIFTLVSGEFLKLILIGLVIASPVAWYLMHNWLQDFAYRIHISAWVFIFSALAALSIALVTVILQILRTALANPVKSLKTE